MQEIGEDPEEAKRIARNNYMKFYRSLRSSLHILKVHHQICPVTTHTKSSQWGGFAYCYGYLVPNYTHIYDYIWISKYMKIYFQIYIYIYIPLCVCVCPPTVPKVPIVQNLCFRRHRVPTAVLWLWEILFQWCLFYPNRFLNILWRSFSNEMFFFWDGLKTHLRPEDSAAALPRIYCLWGWLDAVDDPPIFHTEFKLFIHGCGEIFYLLWPSETIRGQGSQSDQGREAQTSGKGTECSPAIHHGSPRSARLWGHLGIYAQCSSPITVWIYGS